MAHPEGRTIGIGDMDDQRLQRLIERLVRVKRLPRTPAVREVFMKHHADLLDADTQFQRREALHRVQGKLGNAAEIWRQELLGARALIEASLDFSDEADVPSDVYDEIVQRIESVACKIAAAIDRSRRQEVISGGFVVLIAGPPNAGKSTLLNCLVQKDVAITSEFAGTTRDLIEVVLQLGGMRIVLVDTAGIRETEDPVEKMGLEKAFRRAREANLILLLANDENIIVPEFMIDSEIKLLRVSGKKDIHPTQFPGLAISAVTGEGIDELLEIGRLHTRVDGEHDLEVLHARPRLRVGVGVGWPG